MSLYRLQVPLLGHPGRQAGVPGLCAEGAAVSARGSSARTSAAGAGAAAAPSGAELCLAHK